MEVIIKINSMNTQKIETLLIRIQEIRKQRGYSLENMADELGISHSAYYKLENNQSRLTVERLIEISKILNTNISDLLDEASTQIYNQNNNVKDSTIIAKQEFENYNQKDKEITDKLTNVLENEIKHLKSEINFLREILKKK